MEPENFEQSLRAFVRRRPFATFVVTLSDGSVVTVDHPEALILRGGLAVYVSAKGQPTLFDQQSVSRLDFAGASAPAGPA